VNDLFVKYPEQAGRSHGEHPLVLVEIQTGERLWNRRASPRHDKQGREMGASERAAKPPALPRIGPEVRPARRGKNDLALLASAAAD
jgi:hypothetical protein